MATHRAWVAPLMGGVILVVLGLHAWVEKRPETLFEMLYLCHVSSAAIAIGLFTRASRLLSAGVLCLGVLGTPSWLIYMVLTHDVVATSIAAHVLPLAFGIFALGARGMPSGSALAALALFALVLLVSVVVSSPAQNLNLAFRPGPGLEWLSIGTAAWRIALVSTSFALLLGTEQLVRRYVS